MILIETAKQTGGKAGKGHNKTSTIQVIERDGKCSCVIKSFRYTVGNPGSLYKALDKAEKFKATNPSILKKI